MTDHSPRLNLPYLATAQAQKDVTHNEALAALDALVQAVVEDVPRVDPPITPAEGATYIVATAATGAWASQDGALAININGAWQFQPPFDGLTVWLKNFGKTITYSAGSWQIGAVNASTYSIDGQQVVGARAAAIADPTGGSTVDAETRTAVSAILNALRNHGLVATS